MSLALIAAATPLVQLHLACASTAVLLGGWQLAAERGTPAHRLRGRLWVGLIAVVCLGSFGIRSVMPSGGLWGYSPIHLLSVFVLVMLWRAMAAIRRGDADLHGRILRRTYGWGMLVAGLFTLFPGRLLFRALFGA